MQQKEVLITIGVLVVGFFLFQKGDPFSGKAVYKPNVYVPVDADSQPEDVPYNTPQNSYRKLSNGYNKLVLPVQQPSVEMKEQMQEDFLKVLKSYSTPACEVPLQLSGYFNCKEYNNE